MTATSRRAHARASVTSTTEMMMRTRGRRSGGRTAMMGSAPSSPTSGRRVTGEKQSEHRGATGASRSRRSATRSDDHHRGDAFSGALDREELRSKETVPPTCEANQSLRLIDKEWDKMVARMRSKCTDVLVLIACILTGINVVVFLTGIDVVFFFYVDISMLINVDCSSCCCDVAAVVLPAWSTLLLPTCLLMLLIKGRGHADSVVVGAEQSEQITSCCCYSLEVIKVSRG